MLLTKPVNLVFAVIRMLTPVDPINSGNPLQPAYNRPFASDCQPILAVERCMADTDGHSAFRQRSLMDALS